MSRILVFTTDLPFFPGKMGLDFFNIRHLATRHEVTVVGPIYDFAPAEGIRNLENAVDHLLAWPRAENPGTLIVQIGSSGQLKAWVHRFPEGMRRWILRRLLRIHREPQDAFERLAIQANCAPHLNRALRGGVCKAIILIQSNLAPCLAQLPGPGARVVYFHDVRSDYLSRMRSESGMRKPHRECNAIRRQEEEVCQVVDAAAFVSELDKERANLLLKPACFTGVAPIAIDTEYFVPAPSDWKRRDGHFVLFTGHLSHPPNVDAIKHFLAEIWPLVVRKCPTATFVVAGMLPNEELRTLAATTRNFELHANVPDIRPYFWNAGVYVVPMRFGGGVRQKILEAWSMKVPVVCTSMAVEGISALDATNCWLADTPGTFAARVLELLEPGRLPDVTEEAEKQVKATHSIPAVGERFVQLVEKAISIRKNRPFRLLYDLRWMEIGKAGGAEQMTHELIGAISHLDTRNEYRIFCPRSTFHEWRFPRQFKVRPVFSDPGVFREENLRSDIVQQIAGGLGLHQVLTPAMRNLGVLGRMEFDIVHSMVGYIHPDLEAFPQILTALDLQHVHHPEFFPGGEWQERDRLYRDAANRARHIICISEYTRQDMHRHYGIPLEKMSTVWATPSWLASRMLPDSLRNDILCAMGIVGRYVYFPAHGWPHKNHLRLVEAFYAILGEIPSDVRLILSGKPFPEDHPAAVRIRDLKLEGRVRHLGYRSPLEVQALLQGCLLLAFPSLFEGFGMPVAEAILAGKPVACSDRTSLPEVAGDAALTFDPEDPGDIGAKLLEIITNPARHADLSAASLRRRAVFSPRANAIKTLAVYQRVHDEIYN